MYGPITKNKRIKEKGVLRSVSEATCDTPFFVDDNMISLKCYITS